MLKYFLSSERIDFIGSLNLWFEKKEEFEGDIWVWGTPLVLILRFSGISEYSDIPEKAIDLDYLIQIFDSQHYYRFIILIRLDDFTAIDIISYQNSPNNPSPTAQPEK